MNLDDACASLLKMQCISTLAMCDGSYTYFIFILNSIFFAGETRITVKLLTKFVPVPLESVNSTRRLSNAWHLSPCD